MTGVRHQIASRVRAQLGARELDLSRPPGDPGLFGPGSASWKVHGDVAAMTVGGVCALLTQMLHPGAMAGVWDHSGFRKDWTGRLKRTAAFVAGTTYGSTVTAEAMIARVRAIHDKVRGRLADGAPYAASDPALLNWVHAAEVDSFLRSHLRYRDPLMPGSEQDRYLSEQATLARRLGAVDPPDSRAALRRYLAEMRPSLRADERTREVSRLLIAQPSPSLATAPFNAALMAAGVDLMRPWARRLHGLKLAPHQVMGARLGALGVGAAMRWALR